MQKQLQGLVHQKRIFASLFSVTPFFELSELPATVHVLNASLGNYFEPTQWNNKAGNFLNETAKDTFIE